MKTYTQLIEELYESSLGHNRIERLAKSGNLSYKHLDTYVDKHVKRQFKALKTVGKEAVTGAEDISDNIHNNITHYNNNKHKEKQHYNPDIHMDKWKPLLKSHNKQMRERERIKSETTKRSMRDW